MNNEYHEEHNNPPPKELWVNPVAGTVANHQVGPAFHPYRLDERVKTMNTEDQAQERAREVLNRHYDYPSQKLAFKGCLDDFTELLISAEKEARVAAFRDAVLIVDTAPLCHVAGKQYVDPVALVQRLNAALEAANSVPKDSEGEGAN